MTDLVTYFMTFAGETAAALPGKVYDPAAWLALIGTLILAGTISPGRRQWWGALGIGLLAFAVFVLESFYLGGPRGPPVPRGDSAALAIVFVIGWVAGSKIGARFRRSASRP